MAAQARETMKHVARINWNPNDYNERWNEMLARCVEVFGLPGARYSTYVDSHYMDFIFKDAGDRLLFLAAWPAYIPETVEYLSKE
jgi:hypothetical protein